MGSISPLLSPSRRETQQLDKNNSEEESEDILNFQNVGKEIMKNVKTGPKTCRMGDIYHRIKQEVDKISKIEIAKLAPPSKATK